MGKEIPAIAPRHDRHHRRLSTGHPPSGPLPGPRRSLRLPSAPGATYTDNADLSLFAHWTAIPVTGVSLNKSTLALSIGGSETLTATVSPTDALNKTVAWTSSNSAVATVSSTGTVTPVNAGTCTITATTDDGNFKATCTVTDPSALTLTGDNEWTLAAMPAYDIEMSAEYYTDLLESNDGTWLASNNGQVADLWLGRTL